MIRCTIEIIPGGIEDHPRREVIGLVEIANVGGSATTGRYKVVALKKLAARVRNGIWRQALAGSVDSEAMAEALLGDVAGFPRLRLGPYDLLFRALRALGLEERNRR